MKLHYSKERHYNNFMSRVYPEPNTGCWLWAGPLTGFGYANFTAFNFTLGHRYSYFYHKGDFDRNLLVCHTCDNVACVNPDHLFLGTYDDNNKDRHRKGRTVIPIGSKQHSAKLNETMVLIIRDRIKKGEKMAHLAREYGVSKSVMSKINNRTAWKHV